MSPQDLKELKDETTAGDRYLLARDNIKARVKELADHQRRDALAKREEKKKPVDDRSAANMLGKDWKRSLELTVLHRLQLELKAEARIFRENKKNGPIGEKMKEVWRTHYTTYIFVKRCKHCGAELKREERDRHALPADPDERRMAEQMREGFIEEFFLHEFVNH
jgi:hypothetical protein